MPQDSQATFLTKETYDRLSSELEHLSTVGREEIAKKIELARDEGDLKENAGYHAAKDQQGVQEARIVQLTELLRNAVVGDAPQSNGVVEPGTLVTAKIAGKSTTFLVGNREIAEGTDVSVFSEQSPLGQAILGLKVGQKTSYEAPTGKVIAVTIDKVETYSA